MKYSTSKTVLLMLCVALPIKVNFFHVEPQEIEPHPKSPGTTVNSNEIASNSISRNVTDDKHLSDSKGLQPSSSSFEEIGEDETMALTELLTEEGSEIVLTPLEELNNEADFDFQDKPVSAEDQWHRQRLLERYFTHAEGVFMELDLYHFSMHGDRDN